MNGRCEWCVYWRQHGQESRGTCERITAGRSFLAATMSAHANGARFDTSAAFGCVEFWSRSDVAR